MKSLQNMSVTVPFSGARNQPLVQLQRKPLQLPSNSNYTSLSASLTTARSQYEIGGFPFLLGQETNSSGQRLTLEISVENENDTLY